MCAIAPTALFLLHKDRTDLVLSLHDDGTAALVGAVLVVELATAGPLALVHAAHHVILARVSTQEALGNRKEGGGEGHEGRH